MLKKKFPSIDFVKLKDFICQQDITEHSNYINDILINQKDNKIITECEDMNIRIFDSNKNYKYIQILNGHAFPSKNNIYLNKTKEGKKLLSGTEDDIIKIWEMKNTSIYKFKCINTLKGQGGAITLIALINNDIGRNAGKFSSAGEGLIIRILEFKGNYKNSTSITNLHWGKII